MSPRLVLGLGAAAVVVAVAVTLTLVIGGKEEPQIDGVETFEGLGGEHVAEAVEYDQTPPVGGDHFERWLRCGVYDVPVPDEAAVHDLEHGVIWLAYDPDALAPDEIAELADRLPEQGIMSPYPGLGSPVVASAWERQLVLDGVEDPRLAEFVEAYESGENSPESNVGCKSGNTLAELVEAGVPSAPAS